MSGRIYVTYDGISYRVMALPGEYVLGLEAARKLSAGGKALFVCANTTAYFINGETVTVEKYLEK